MPLPDQTPKLPKWPFLLGDAALIAAAWLIAVEGGSPLPAEAVFSIVACVIAAAVAGAVPFLTDYARRQDEALDERQRALEALSRTVATAGEQVGITAGGFHEIAALADKNLKRSEQLSRKFEAETEAMKGRLEAVEVKIESLRSAAAAVLAAAEKAAAAGQALAAAAGERARAPAAAEPEPSAPPAAGPAPGAEPQEAAPETPAPAVAEPRRERRSRKAAAKAEPELPAEAPPAPAAGPEAAAPSEAALELEEPSAPALSSDGATRLIVTAYIGIGNRPFIRGEGPGLSWEKGAPLQFVSIGRWRWETADASAAVKFKLYKNDETEWALGLRRLEPGQQQELTATF